eukprot:213385_1
MARKDNDSKFNKFASYSEFVSEVDPSKEEEACLLRSGLIYPSNQALIQQTYNKNLINSKQKQISHLNTNQSNTNTKVTNHHNDTNTKNEFYKRLYRCHLCIEEYITKESLNKHIKMRHLINNNNINDIIIQKWYCS